MFKTINKDAVAEIVEKKSKFIASLFYVENVEEAEEKIKEIKKKYFDARHNCFAYRIATESRIVERFSDDGEPSGTAGAPMLTVLAGNNLANVLVVVTRYFGGILLGTGGLIKAYTLSTQEALKNSSFEEKDLGLEVEIQVSYQDFEKFKYYCKLHEIKICKIEYLENIKNQIELTKDVFCQIQNTKNELNFEIKDIKILKEKYITL